MSEARRVRELAPEFLQIVYDLNIEESSNIVTLDRVAEYLQPNDLDTGGSEYVDTLSRVAQFLGQKGFLDRQTSDWFMFNITREGMDEVEGTNRPPQPQSVTNFNFAGSELTNAVIGNNNTANFSGQFDFSNIEERIRRETGEDAEELLSMVRDIRSLLDNGGTINRGYLSRLNDKLRKYDWLANAVAGWLLNFATQG